MGKRENKVEKYLNEEIENIGGITRKWENPLYPVPDRIVMIHGIVWFVEVKTTDGVTSSAQKREHKRLLAHCYNVTTVVGHEGVDDFIKHFYFN